MILFLTDIGGHLAQPSQALADKFAALGKYIVVAPDLFNGEPIAIPAPGEGYPVLPEGWFERHSPQQVDPIIELTLGEIERRFKPTNK